MPQRLHPHPPLTLLNVGNKFLTGPASSLNSAPLPTPPAIRMILALPPNVAPKPFNAATVAPTFVPLESLK